VIYIAPKYQKRIRTHNSG